MSAICKRSKKVINVNFCVPNCGHFQTNWLNFCPQLGYSQAYSVLFDNDFSNSSIALSLNISDKKF